MLPLMNAGDDSSSSRTMIEETSTVNKKLSSVDYLHTATLPFDLIEEILCRLPVKPLLQFRCVCKSWNSLISDTKFTKKHLSMSTRRHLHLLSYSNHLSKHIITSCPLHCVSTTVSTNDVTQLEYPSNRLGYPDHEMVGSYNGILCLAQVYSNMSYILLWNPSIRKVNELPCLKDPRYTYISHKIFGFGYDFVTDNYKVIAILTYDVHDSGGDVVCKTIVKVNTLGSIFWKNIKNFPFDSSPEMDSGIFVSGTINWLISKPRRERSCFIVSLDLGKESYRKVVLPDHRKEDVTILYLSVLRDCLCMIYGHDIWIMKEYGNNESWTKLFTVSYMQDPSMSYYLTKAFYMFEDDQVLLQSFGDLRLKLIVYDPKIGTFKFIKFQNKSICDMISRSTEFCLESLISPCS
ncbi:hypothetical protein TSUD_280240 [Trifolium subterraneum]|uniref:F-box domain-containing protein n=1 Tax=Trifolium subterraneum TaxID=3900 RepID=A0A2Z6PEM3_TRISU|nr:hypothetical protein TSUD_280240 [Trifolium subterraneum]